MLASNNKTPTEFRQELLDLLTEQGLPQAISAFKKSVSNRSEAYRVALEMEVQYKELQREFFGGQISKENESVESNRLTKSFINLIERLETEPQLLSVRKANQRKVLRWGVPLLLVILSLVLGYWFWGADTNPKPTVGKVLYAIPSKMQVGKETECLVVRQVLNAG